MSYAHLVDLYRTSLTSHQRPDAFLRRTDRGVEAVASAQARERIEQIAAALVVRGVARGDRIAIWCEPRLETLLVELAAASVQAVVVGIDPSWSAEVANRVLEDADPALIFISSQAPFVVTGGRSGLAATASVLFDPPSPTEPAEPAGAWSTFLADGREALRATPLLARSRANDVMPDDLATIVYREDKSGTPLGVMLTQGNLVAGVEILLRTFTIGREDVLLIERPPSDLAQRILAYAVLMRGGTIVFSRPGPQTSVAEERMAARPTLTLLFPEDAEREVHAFADDLAASRRGRRLLARARQAAGRRQRLLTAGRSMPLRLRVVFSIYSWKVFRLLARRFGGNLRFALVDARPLSSGATTLLSGANLPVYLGFGAPETSWLVAANAPSAARTGTWGRPLGNLEVRVAYDGEVLVRGASVTPGYWRRPAESAAALENRWFHTGFQGSLDEEGYLRLGGRKTPAVMARAS